MATLVTRRIRLGVTTWAIEQETGLSRYTVDKLLSERTQLEALPLRIATRLAEMLGLSSPDQLISSPAGNDHANDAPLDDTRRIAAALQAWGEWVQPDEITQVLELTAGRTTAALAQLPKLLAGTGATLLSSPQLGIRIVPDPDLLDDTDLDEIAQLQIRSNEPTYRLARVINQALLGIDTIPYGVGDTTNDALSRLGYLQRRRNHYDTHPDIEYSITEAAAETRSRQRTRRGRGAAAADNPPIGDPNQQ